MKTISYYNSPIGKILLASDEQGLVGLWLDTDHDYHGDILAKTIPKEKRISSFC